VSRCTFGSQEKKGILHKVVKSQLKTINHGLPRACVALLACLFICCNTATEKSMNSDSLKSDSSIASTDSMTANNQKSNDPIILKHVILEKNVPERLSKSKILTGEEMKSFSIRTMDSVAADEFKYHLLDTLFWAPEIKIILLGREYLEENIIWVACYDLNNNLTDHLQVYYDNSEGFSTMLSEINNNLITVFDQPDEGNDESKQKPSLYSLNRGGKFIKLK